MKFTVLHILRYLVAFILVGMPFYMMAQTDSLSAIKDVSIETKYRPKLADAVKISPMPLMMPPKAESISYDYKVPDVSFSVKPIYKILDPVYLKISENPEVYGNFLKAGIGNYFTPYLKLHLHNHSNKYYDYGVSLSHLSSNASTPEFANFSDNSIRVFGSKKKGSNILRGTLNYTRNVLHYYGANADQSDFTADSVNQILNRNLSHLSWKTKVARKVDFSTKLRHGYFSSLTKSEHTARLDATINGKGNQGQLALPVRIVYNWADRPNVNAYNRTVFSMNPNYQFKFEKYRIKVGLLAGYFADSTSEKSAPFITPDLSAYFFVVPQKMKAFISITGKYSPYTYSRLFEMNPFIGDQIELKNEFTPVNLQTGVKGQVQGKIDYGISVQYKTTQNQAMFRMDSTHLRRYEVLYDLVNTFTFHSEVGVNINQILTLGGEFNWYNYNLEKEMKWNLPDYDLRFNLDAKLKEKIYINLRLYGVGPRLSNNIDNATTESLKPFYDLNASLDYRYKKNISFFVNVNNIVGGRYQRWYRYPVYGLNALVGVTATL